MADSIQVPHQPIGSAWAPLREPLFRSLWGAAVISYTGTWMQNVGAGWLMTQLTMSPLMVSLVMAATALPVFLVILPAGALADMLDRRRFLLITQAWMVGASALLGVFTLLGHITPWILLAFTFLLGLGAVMNDPAWQAITPEIVSHENHAPAVALNSVGFNVARAIGPALGGLVIAATSSGIAFLLNSASFFGVIYFLYRWKRSPLEKVSTGGVRNAIREGVVAVRESELARCVLVRTGAFSIAASSLLALLPILARPHGATGYGLSLAYFGVGALIGAAVLPKMRRHASVDRVVLCATLLFAAMTSLAAYGHGFGLLSVSMLLAGAGWIAIVACLNVAAQTMLSPWLRARGISIYLLVLQGGMAVGSALWGALANRIGVPLSLLSSAATLIVGLAAARRYPLALRQVVLQNSSVR